MSIKDRLDEIDRAISELHLGIERLKAEEKTLVAARTMKNYGLGPGAVVRAKGKRYEILDIAYLSGEPWRLAVHPEKKDGTFGSAVRYLYVSDGWELEKGEAEA